MLPTSPLNMKKVLRRDLTSFILLGSVLLQLLRPLLGIRELTIGGLFGDNESENVVNVFKYAVYRVSHERGLLRNIKLMYAIQRFPEGNRFEASKRICDQLAMQSICMFGPVNHEAAAFAGSACSSLNIPHIETRNDASSAPLPSFTINIHPDAELLARAVLDVILVFGWNDMLILYSHYTGLLKVQSLLRASNETSEMSVNVRQVDTHNMRAVLKEAKKKRWRHIITELNITETSNFLKTALQEGMIDSYHHIIINNMDIEMLDLEDYRHNYVNLTGFRLVNLDDEFTRNTLFDMDLYKENTQLRILSNTILPYQCALIFDAVYLLAHALTELERAMIFPIPNTTCDELHPWTGGRLLYNFLNSVQVNGLTGPIRLSQGRRRNFKLDVLELGEEGLHRTGIWEPSTGANISQRRFLAQGVFGNKTLIVSTLLEPPYAMLRKEPENDKVLRGNDRYEGFCIDMLNEIAQIIGFDFKIEPVPDGRYGVRDKQGNWDGIVQQLVDGKADLAVAALTISYEREQYIDFTKPFLNLGISILFKSPRREKPYLFSFLKPLAVEIWIYILAAYFIVSLAIFVIARFSPYEWYVPHQCNPITDTIENKFTLSNSFWFCVGTLMQQGSDINPRAVSTRIVGSTWWLFTLIIIASYTANLAAFLTVERMVSPIQSAEDLAKQTDILYGTLAGGSTMSFFRDSTIEIYQRMWNFMESKDPSLFTKTVEEGVNLVETGGYAYLMESTSIEYIIQRNCNLMQVGGLLDSKGYGIGTPMDSPLKDKLSMAVLNMQEEGKVQMLYNKWWKSSGQCIVDDNKDSKANALGVENVGGIFVFLLGGLTMAAIVAGLEFVWNSKTNASDGKQSLCSEMADELCLAVRCQESSKKLKRKRTVCLNCKSNSRKPDCPLKVDKMESMNGVMILMKNPQNDSIKRRENHSGDFELDYMNEKCGDFGAGGYLHVELSDMES